LRVGGGPDCEAALDARIRQAAARLGLTLVPTDAELGERGSG